MATGLNQPPVNGQATTGFTTQVSANQTPAPAPQSAGQASLGSRKWSHKKPQQLAITWGLLTLLCIPVAFLAPNWLYIVAAAGVYRLVSLAGWEIKFKPGRLLRKILLALIVMALALFFMRSEANKLAEKQRIPLTPLSASEPVQAQPPMTVRFHP
jgi:hypothetical protein